MALDDKQQEKVAKDASIAAVSAIASLKVLDRIADLMARDFGYNRAREELGDEATFAQVKARAEEIHRSEIAKIRK